MAFDLPSPSPALRSPREHSYTRLPSTHSILAVYIRRKMTEVREKLSTHTQCLSMLIRFNILQNACVLFQSGTNVYSDLRTQSVQPPVRSTSSQPSANPSTHQSSATPTCESAPPPPPAQRTQAGAAVHRKFRKLPPPPFEEVQTRAENLWNEFNLGMH